MVTRLVYTIWDGSTTFPLEDSVNAFAATFVPAYLAATSKDMTLMDITGIHRGPGVAGNMKVITVNDPGEVDSDALPPFVTYGFRKNPDNSTVTGGDPFLPGSVRISGVPESFQANGFLAPAANTEVEALANAIYTFEDTENSNEFTLCMRRGGWFGTAEPPAGFVLVAGVTFTRIGTQNTRKWSG